ncbi:MAG: ComEC/Rec2 family competence protein [bacterium]|nr:ComEC/Rec2 family competence protein [bacterium]
MVLSDVQSLFQLATASYLVSDWLNLVDPDKYKEVAFANSSSEFSKRFNAIQNTFRTSELHLKEEHENVFNGECENIGWAIHPVGAEFELLVSVVMRIALAYSFCMLLVASFWANLLVSPILGVVLVGGAILPLLIVHLGLVWRLSLVSKVVREKMEISIRPFEQAMEEFGLDMSSQLPLLGIESKDHEQIRSRIADRADEIRKQDVDHETGL